MTPNPSFALDAAAPQVTGRLTRRGLGSQSCWTRAAAPVNSIVMPLFMVAKTQAS